MEAHIQTFLNRLSLFSILLGTALLLRLFLLSPHPCPTPSTTTSRSSFPTTSCSPTIHHRPYLPLTNQTYRLLKSRSHSHYPSLFLDLAQNLPFSLNDSKSLLLSAAPGFSYLALRGLGAEDVTAVDVVDSPPYVSRADPHNLPFFDGVFDLAFTDGLDQALFPRRYVSQMERVVRKGGVCVVAFEEEVGDEVVREVVGLFRSGKVTEGDTGVKNVTFGGFSLTRIVLRIG
ncbi:hypothetical protein MLD38_003069 [Melastoma candidum]|uniref:Uncharacterized protein n=1 Tax=Melastoma candidum TaxID=119954 RepID=A0ACB9S2R8_9MYRT|nr:hypothetical protein MLD38_003069 [Melastoma candidum]